MLASPFRVKCLTKENEPITAAEHPVHSFCNTAKKGA